LSLTQISKLSGTGVTRDFVEVPATVVERFMLIPGFLRRVSHHYSHLSPEYAEMWRSEQAAENNGGEVLPLPEKQVSKAAISANLQKLQEAKRFWRIDTLAVSRFELAVYNPASREDIVNMNIAETYNRIQRDTTLLHGPDAVGERLDWGNMYAQLRSLAYPDACTAYAYLTYVSVPTYGFVSCLLTAMTDAVSMLLPSSMQSTSRIQSNFKSSV
jgi:metallopeptidase MepB